MAQGAANLLAGQLGLNGPVDGVMGVVLGGQRAVLQVFGHVAHFGTYSWLGNYFPWVYVSVP
jgi:hypothetical protein